MKTPSNRFLMILTSICFLGAATLFGVSYISRSSNVQSETTVTELKEQGLGLEKYQSIEIERTTAETDKAAPSEKTTTNANSDFSPEVNWFLSAENSDMGKLVSSGDKKLMDRARIAALELTNRLVPCLIKKETCPYYPKDNQEYYFKGGTPVFHALERALDFFEMASADSRQAEARPSIEILSQAMNLPHTGISFKAAVLLLSTSENQAQQVATLQSASVLGPIARVMFLQFAAGMKEDRTKLEFGSAFNQAVHDSVGGSSDSFTRSETVKRLDQLDLDQETFKRVSGTACQMASDSESRASVRSVLQRKAKAAGFDFSSAELCSG